MGGTPPRPLLATNTSSSVAAGPTNGKFNCFPTWPWPEQPPHPCSTTTPGRPANGTAHARGSSTIAAHRYRCAAAGRAPSARRPSPARAFELVDMALDHRVDRLAIQRQQRIEFERKTFFELRHLRLEAGMGLLRMKRHATGVVVRVALSRRRPTGRWSRADAACYIRGSRSACASRPAARTRLPWPAAKPECPAIAPVRDAECAGPWPASSAADADDPQRRKPASRPRC